MISSTLSLGYQSITERNCLPLQVPDIGLVQSYNLVCLNLNLTVNSCWFELHQNPINLIQLDNWPGDEFGGTASKFRNRERKILSWSIYVPHKVSHKEVSYTFSIHSVTAKKCIRRVWYIFYIVLHRNCFISQGKMIKVLWRTNTMRCEPW